MLYDDEVDRFLARRLLDPEPEELPPPSRRQEDLRSLLHAGRVEIARSQEGPWGGFVHGRGGRYAVRLETRDGIVAGSCACPFFQRFSQERGPCKHLLAARMAAEEGAD